MLIWRKHHSKRYLKLDMGKVVLSVFIATLVNSCVLLNTRIDDLRYEYVKVIDVKIARKYISQDIGDLSLITKNNYGFEISFSSSRNIGLELHKKSMNPVIHVYECANKSHDLTMLSNNLYFDDIEIGYSGPLKVEKDRYLKATKDKKRIIFEYYVLSSYDANSKEFFNYDLLEHPFDICFYIEGGNMLGAKIRSNTVKIKKIDIENAIKNL